MELYLFMRGTLAWTVLLAVAFPLNVPLAALAYKIWRGNRPLDEDERDELWLRSTLAAAALGVTSVVFVLLDYALADWAKLPPGPVHLIVYLALVGLAAWLLMLFFAIEDFFGALSLLVVYFYLPIFVLWLFNAVTGLFNPLLGYLTNNWLAKP